MAGLPVDSAQAVGDLDAAVRVGRLDAVEPHAGAERLFVCRVDVGEGAMRTVVSAAPGLERGRLVAVALPGTRLPDGRIVLNLATVEDLQRLPGVGQRRAEAILELRARLKKFRRTTDLLRVRGIGAKSLKRLEPLLVIDPPGPQTPAPPGPSATQQ